MKEVEKKVRLKLEEQGMKFNAFCEKVGMSEVAMRKIFQRNNCKVDDLIKISEALSVPVSYFFDETPMPNYVSVKNMDECMKEVDFLRMQIKYMQDVIDAKDELLQNYRSQVNNKTSKAS